MPKDDLIEKPSIDERFHQGDDDYLLIYPDSGVRWESLYLAPEDDARGLVDIGGLIIMCNEYHGEIV